MAILAALAVISCVGAPKAGAKLTGDADSKLVWGYDSNVLESIRAQRRAADSFVRLEASFNLRGDVGRWGQPQASLRWAGECYRLYREENRNLLQGMLTWRWGDRLRWTRFAWNYGLTAYPAASQRDVVRHAASVQRSVPLWRNIRLQASAGGICVRSRAGEGGTRVEGPSARHAWQLGADLRRSIGGRWQVLAGADWGQIKYDRAVVKEPIAGEMRFSEDNQRDRSLLCVARLSRKGLPLLSLSYGYRTIWSNSFGFSLQRHELGLLASCMLPRRFSLQLIGRLEDTRYEEPGYIIFLPAEETEDPDLGARNGLTLQLRRPLGEGWSGEVRASWHRNEALVLRRFYEKTRLMVAIRYSLD
ncbi:MAG: hypothetical protein KAY24_03395 [Candidatus Eisenbacteria sp.]|nr:hypothetical protein [Candidatus Eisenbacteria bacterium]